MKIQLFIQLLILISANMAFALPVMDGKKFFENPESANCSRKPQLENFRDLIHNANVIGQDDRQPVSSNMEIVGFTPAEREQAMRCTGHIYCPVGPDGPSMQSAGAICGPGARNAKGKCKADRLGTVGHMFVNEVTNRFYPRVNECEFRNYRGHSSQLVVGDLNVINPAVDSNNPHKNMRADKLVVRLKTPIQGCDPYDLDESPAAPPVNTEMIALTHMQKDQEGKFDGSEPMAYPCYVTETFEAQGGGPSVFYSDCDVNKIGSGGFTLGRNVKTNKWNVLGMFTGSGSASRNGEPYDKSRKSFTVSVGVNADFAIMASKPGSKPEPQLSQGLAPVLRPTSGN